jgi:hypothetical protein
VRAPRRAPCTHQQSMETCLLRQGNMPVLTIRYGGVNERVKILETGIRFSTL